MTYIPANNRTAVIHAYKLSENDVERNMAMWAACQLMALHDRESGVLQGHADIWADKIAPQSPSSSEK